MLKIVSHNFIHLTLYCHTVLLSYALNVKNYILNARGIDYCNG